MDPEKDTIQTDAQPPMGEPQTPELEPIETHEAHASKNLIIIAVLAVIVIVLAVLYIWGSSVSMQDESLPAPLPAEDAQTEALEQVGTSTDIPTIEEDLDSTDLDNLDAEMDQVMVEIDAAAATQ